MKHGREMDKEGLERWGGNVGRREIKVGRTEHGSAN